VFRAPAQKRSVPALPKPMFIAIRKHRRGIASVNASGWRGGWRHTGARDQRACELPSDPAKAVTFCAKNILPRRVTTLRLQSIADRAQLWSAFSPTCARPGTSPFLKNRHLWRNQLASDHLRSFQRREFRGSQLDTVFTRCLSNYLL